MKLKKCEYCGTEFDAALSQCPLCGKAVQPGAAEPQPVMPAAYKPAGGHGGKFSKKKGGRFAQHCAPARVVSVLLSDVLGDRPAILLPTRKRKKRQKARKIPIRFRNG